MHSTKKKKEDGTIEHLPGDSSPREDGTKSVNRAPPTPLVRSHRSHNESLICATLAKSQDRNMSTDDDSYCGRLLKHDTGLSYFTETSDAGRHSDSSSSSVEIRRFSYSKSSRRAPFATSPEEIQTPHISPMKRAEDTNTQLVASTTADIDGSGEDINSSMSSHVGTSKQQRKLNKRKEIRTAEDRRRAIAQTATAAEAEAVKAQAKRKVASKRFPVLPGKESSDSSESSPDVEPTAKEKPVDRRAVIRKCPVEQIDVDCEMGHRPYMEDALVALQDITAYLPENSRIKNSLEPTAFFGVYDGHGGLQASRYVQKFFHMRLLEKLKEFKETEDVNGQKEPFDMHSVIHHVYRRIDHDFLVQCNIPLKGIPPLLPSRAHEDIVSEHERKKSSKKVEARKERRSRKRHMDKKAAAFTAGPYVQRIMHMQRDRAVDRSNLGSILRNIPTKDPNLSLSIDDLIRNSENFDLLHEKDAISFRKFVSRFSSTNAEAYESIKSGKTDFRRSVASNNLNESGAQHDTWSDRSFLTSDDNASELSGVDSDTGHKPEGDDGKEEDVSGIVKPPSRPKDDPMTKNPPTPGSTVCVCLIDKQHIYSSWVGDSEAVLFSKGGKITSLTNPHSPLRDDEADRIKKLGGVIVKQCVPSLKKTIGRVQGQLSVSRAIGDAHLKRWVSSDPETMKTALLGDEEFAVIASDGLWDVLSFKEVYRLVSRYIATDRKTTRHKVKNSDGGGGDIGQSPQQQQPLHRPKSQNGFVSCGDQTAVNRSNRVANTKKNMNKHQWAGCARYLIRTALTCGSSDNISVIVIFFHAAINASRAERYSRSSQSSSIQSVSPSPKKSIDFGFGSAGGDTDSSADYRSGRGLEGGHERRGLFSGVGLFNRARIRRVFARNSHVELGSISEDEDVLLARAHNTPTHSRHPSPSPSSTNNHTVDDAPFE
eukprot:GHVH01004453.1.p1 GENE.GHVH01004453.1~~GHVH01004453.1.p1  ORF type:complete len:936 (-),score=103.01 GHVH01004453.1:377-3184(-)